MRQRTDVLLADSQYSRFAVVARRLIGVINEVDSSMAC